MGTLDPRAYIAHRISEHQQAFGQYHWALTLLRALGDAYEGAYTLNPAGHLHLALCEHEKARAVWREALELYREHGRGDDADRGQLQLDTPDGD